ncbi:MAG: UbiD family decarboxylase [Ancrocorticia sp.]|jgi:4-hydroxy-3-polyprenylbenzoate decarboxylase|nr:UbiD family decarboxylase [Ancrocorticia sp.]
MSASLRDYLRVLADRGELVTIDEQVCPEADLGAVLALLEAGPAVIARHVGDHAMPVVGNVVTSRQRAALALGVSEQSVSEVLTASIGSPIEPNVVSSGPCCDVREAADLTRLPIPTFFPRETGPYITAGVIAVRDVETGQRNLSFARFKVLDANHAMLGVSPNHHLGKMAERALARGSTLPIAVAIGVHPAISLAACLYMNFGDDELASAGALLGAPVDVVETDSGIRVPADAELVLEGVVHPEQKVREGLVSEFHGRYHDYGEGYVVEFEHMRRRQNPYFQVILPSLHQEHILLGALSIAASLKATLQQLIPGVVDVAVPDVGAGRTSAIVSIKNAGPGVPQQAMMACFSHVSLIKQVIVVDAEVDPWNTASVEWARLCHARPERDYLVVPHARTDRSDPLVATLTVGKLGVDATVKAGDRAEGWAFARSSDEALVNAASILRRAGVVAAPSQLMEGIRFRAV